ncbi:MAG: hypothetical protein KJO72_05680 [Gammaproteobacteria bacterium]|nr:hypothetical protein [Gammaproteobacteria bacterium]
MMRAWLIASIVLLTFGEANAARLVEWVENASASDASRIALGYPVPIPVDTALPFNGFRSYDGLHMRHQDLAATTPWVHGQVIGSTYTGRPIWVYQLGDADHETAYGLPEQAMLSNGGIHAREWQSPEVATGIIELIAGAGPDNALVAYLRDNANILVIPVLNVDGYLQTQRTPSFNWVGADPRYPEDWPRDGRMRRKNMHGADDDLQTEADHLQGVDLNRNNEPFWASSERSSYDTSDLVYHGAHAASEPEIQALDAAAQLGPADQLSLFTDLHSYSQVHFWQRSTNDRLTLLTERLLSTFTRHHQSFPAGKYYWYANRWNLPVNQGIGTTDEYFTYIYEVPSWTLEIEPSGGEHDGLPGGGADYGGLGRNGHDGFILPESQVERVRTELAQTFAVAYYQQTAPPSLKSLHLIDDATGATVFAAGWDVVDARHRSLFRFQAQPLQVGRDYRAWVAWDKPMRWRENGEVAALPGQSSGLLGIERTITSDAAEITGQLGEPSWLDTAGGAPGGYLRYRDDAAEWSFSLPANETNLAALQGIVDLTLGVGVRDLVSIQSDADPATVARWQNGAWSGYEAAIGLDGGDTGGVDTTLTVQATADDLGDPFVLAPGTSAAWFDIERSGEGFLVEMLADQRAVMYWFTYDTEGKQDWYTAVGEVRGNRLVFPEMILVSGGEFGPGFDPEKVTRSVIGSASFTWSGCDSGVMDWVIDGDSGPLRQGRMKLDRLTNVMALPCDESDPTPGVPSHQASRLSGSWYDPSHSGEGYILQVLDDLRILVYWFSYDAGGQRRWFYGVGTHEDDSTFVFEDLYTTRGGVFGAGFDPDTVESLPWGRLELELACDSGTARFNPTETGFEAGELALIRLTVLDGLECTD